MIKESKQREEKMADYSWNLPSQDWANELHPQRYQEERVVGVREALATLKRAITPLLLGVWIRGEVSNLKRSSAGHVYFTLKDGSANLRAVVFRQRGLNCSFREGDAIEVKTRPGIYEGSGDLQLYVDEWRHVGLGELYEAFRRLSAQLQREGLFDESLKRAIPRFVKKVGIVTSAQAAALQDVLRTLQRRTPWVHIILYPALVQGQGAALSLKNALTKAAQANEVELLLLVRGGGSFEDLNAFNDEMLARVIRQMPMPVICGVGHESDTTIADMVADLRASTPTAAAEHVGEPKSVWVDLINAYQKKLEITLKRGIEEKSKNLNADAFSLHWHREMRQKEGSLKSAQQQLQQTVSQTIRIKEERSELSIDFLSTPEKALSFWSEKLQLATDRLKREPHQIWSQNEETLQVKTKQHQQSFDHYWGQIEQHLAQKVKHLQSPYPSILREGKRLEALAKQTKRSWTQIETKSSSQLTWIERTLQNQNPYHWMDKGFVYVSRNGMGINDVTQLSMGEDVDLTFARGQAVARIEKIVADAQRAKTHSNEKMNGETK